MNDEELMKWAIEQAVATRNESFSTLDLATIYFNMVRSGGAPSGSMATMNPTPDDIYVKAPTDSPFFKSGLNEY